MFRERQKDLEINAIVFTILLYLFRATVPFLKYPFIILLIGLSIYVFRTYRSNLVSTAISFLKVFYLSIALLIILLLSFLLSDKIFLIIFKDLANTIILLFLFYLLIIIVSTQSELKHFADRLIYISVFFAVLVSILLILKFFNFSGSYHRFNPLVLFGPLSNDYNFALIPVLFGLIGVLSILHNEKSWRRIIFLNFGLLLFSLAISLSGSRRGLIILILIVSFLIALQIFIVFRKDSKLRKVGENTRFYTLSIILVFFLSWLYVFHASYYLKKSVFEIIGVNDVETTRQRIAQKFYKYKSIFHNDCTISEVYDDIWFHGSDYENYPDEWWGTRIHKTVFPLKGKNVEIVPQKAEGYLLDYTSDADKTNEKAYSTTVIDARQVKDGDLVVASVYCYVSKEFNGGDVKIYSTGSTYGDTIANYSVLDCSMSSSNVKNDDYYKLTIDSTYFYYDNQNHEKNLFLNGDFKNGNKYWTPGADSTEHEVIETPYGQGLRVSRKNGDGGSFSLYYSGRPIVYNEGHTYKLNFKYKVINGALLPFKVGWAINDESKSLVRPLSIIELGNGWKEATCTYKFKKKELNPPAFLNSLEDYSIVDLADIKLTDIDRNDSLPLFVDQIMEMEPNRKGIWQKLSINAKCKKGVAPVFMYFSKTGAHDFTSLKGYVIFAYPQYTVITKNDSLKSKLVPLRKIISTSISKVEPILSDSILFERSQGSNNLLSDFVQKKQHLKDVSFETNQRVNYVQVASFLPVQIKFQDKDIIRKWASQIVSEDTTYYPFKNKLSVSTSNSEFIGFRKMRWQFGFEIFTKEFNWKQKVFGGGFNFLNWYGYYFGRNKTFIDYPHNPFLSILLYSGVIGLLLYCFFLYKSIGYFIRFYSQIKLVVVFFIITYLFSFFSAGSPFDPPIMGFFSMLPFFINYVYKSTENRNQIDIRYHSK